MPEVEAQQSYRMLWAQVVLQAKADLENEPIDSILFNQASAFFISRGEWAQSRAIVADCLEMHPDDLCRCGERWIADRRKHEGLAPEPARPVRSEAPAPLPRLEAIPAAAPATSRPRRVVTPRLINPFGMKSIALADAAD